MSNRWSIIYYVSGSGEIPVRDFLNSSDPALKAKAFRLFMYVEEYGLEAIIAHVKKLSGVPLWEIRIMGRTGVRILFVTQKEKQVLLLHAFYKKTQKTPLKEIAIALSRFKEY